MSQEPRRGADSSRRLVAVPLSARHLRAWIACFELALDISHLVPAWRGAKSGSPGQAPDPSGSAARRRLLDTAARLPLALAQAQASGPEAHAARCFDDALAGMAELETHVELCRRLGWLDPQTLDDLGARCASVRGDLICLAAEARDAALQRLQHSHRRTPDATITT